MSVRWRKGVFLSALQISFSSRVASADCSVRVQTCQPRSLFVTMSTRSRALFRAGVRVPPTPIHAIEP